VDSFAILTYQGNVNPASTVTIEGNIGALYTVMLRNGTVNGDLYSENIVLWPGLTLNGTQNNYTSYASAAYASAQLLYQELSALPCQAPIQCPTQTFTSGVYCYNGSLVVTHHINFTFDARGDPTAVFVLMIEGHIQGMGGQMNLINGAQPCNIFVLVAGQLQPARAVMLVGIWLVAGNIDAAGDIEVTGKLISLGPGHSPNNETNATLMGQGDINPSGRLRINRCACLVTGAPTLAPSASPSLSPTITPTLMPTPLPITQFGGGAIAASVFAGLLVAVAVCWLLYGYRGRPARLPRRYRVDEDRLYESV
jgi:hypothetical protein